MKIAIPLPQIISYLCKLKIIEALKKIYYYNHIEILKKKLLIRNYK